MAGIIFLVLMFVVAWLVLILPQQRRVRAQQALVAKLEEGDEVMTTAGIFGTIMEIDGDVIHLEVADDVEIRIARGAVARRIPEPAGELDDDDVSSDVEDRDDATADAAVDETVDD